MRKGKMQLKDGEYLKRNIYAIYGKHYDERKSFPYYRFINWILIRKAYLQNANSFDQLICQSLVSRHIRINNLSLYDVPVGITDHIRHQRQWKKIIKREYIIFVKLQIL